LAYEEIAMNHVAKVIEVIGTSESGLEDAIKGAIERASKTVDNLQWFQVTEIRGALSDGSIQRFQVMMKIGFGLNDDQDAGAAP
jgi:dodecin